MSETVSASASSPASAGSTSTGAQGSAQTSAQQTASPSSQTQSQGSSPAQTGTEAPKVEAQPSKRYLEADAEEAYVKLKIDGQEQELSLKELKRLSSLERASQKRMQDAARIQREFQQVQDMLKKDPAQVLKQVGRDPKAWAEDLLAKEFELMQMSPEQRENLELKARIEAQEKAERDSKRGVIEEIKKLSGKVPENLDKYSKEDLANYRDHLVSVNQQATQALEQEMIAAWEESKLPKHKTFGNWMAMEMIGHEKRTGETLQAKDAAAKVRSDYQKFDRMILGQMDAAAIHEWLGNEIVQKIIDHKIQSATTQAAQGFQNNSPAGNPAASEQPKKYVNQSEWRKAMGIG